MPQDVPSQVATPFWGTGQAEQEVPQLAVPELDTQALPQRCVPALHCTPQEKPLQVGTPLPDGLGHGAHELPQLSALVLDKQRSPHR